MLACGGATSPSRRKLEIGDLQIDVAGHSVKRSGSALSLTPLEFDLLVALARKPWQVFTREVLLEQVWGYRHAGVPASQRPRPAAAQQGREGP